MKIKTEHEEQREFVQWFRQNIDGVRIFAIPNGGVRSLSVASKLKSEGVSAGVPDMFVPAWLLWIEMKKSKGGITSDKQKDWHEYLRGIGHYVIIPKGCDEAIAMVQDFVESVE